GARERRPRRDLHGEPANFDTRDAGPSLSAPATLALGGTTTTRSRAPASEFTSNSLCPYRKSSRSRGRPASGLRSSRPSPNSPSDTLSSDVSEPSGAKLVTRGQSKNSAVTSPSQRSIPSSRARLGKP